MQALTQRYRYAQRQSGRRLYKFLAQPLFWYIVGIQRGNWRKSWWELVLFESQKLGGWIFLPEDYPLHSCYCCRCSPHSDERQWKCRSQQAPSRVIQTTNIQANHFWWLHYSRRWQNTPPNSNLDTWSIFKRQKRSSHAELNHQRSVHKLSLRRKEVFVDKLKDGPSSHRKHPTERRNPSLFLLTKTRPSDSLWRAAIICSTTVPAGFLGKGDDHHKLFNKEIYWKQRAAQWDL